MIGVHETSTQGVKVWNNNCIQDYFNFPRLSQVSHLPNQRPELDPHSKNRDGGILAHQMTLTVSPSSVIKLRPSFHYFIVTELLLEILIWSSSFVGTHHAVHWGWLTEICWDAKPSTSADPDTLQLTLTISTCHFVISVVEKVFTHLENEVCEHKTKSIKYFDPWK